MNRRIARDERGSALVYVLLFATAAAALGMSLVAQAMNENDDLVRQRDKVRALYSAEAGCVEIVSRMADPSSASYVGPDLAHWSSTPGWGVYVRLAGDSTSLASEDPSFSRTAHDGLDNDADGHSDEAGESYPVKSVPRFTDPNNEVRYAWARASFLLDPSKKILRFGDNDGNAWTPPTINSTVGDPVVIVTAVGASGKVRRTVEMTCVKATATSRYLVTSRRQVSSGG